MELLYAVLVAETEELLMEKLCKWKRSMELKGLRVNIDKTKVMRCQVRIGQAEESGKYPCGVCRQGVGDNSIKCVACHKWVHKRCSGISGRLGYVADFRCRTCLDGDSALVVLLSEVKLEPGVKVDCVSKFCYLGDTLGSGGGVVGAARARVRCAWAKFKELSLILHCIVSKEGSIVLVSRVFWYMELKPRQWRLMIWEVWKAQNVWWWDGCVGWPWKTEGAAFLVLIVLLMWWGVEDWDSLDIWNVRVYMIGCLLAEGWWWRGEGPGQE